MRQEASELVKGEWYCDLNFDGRCNPTFLMFSHIENSRYQFSRQTGEQDYDFDESGFISFNSIIFQGYLPTPEDIEKYNLNEKE